jgi:hypothetical protein
MDAALDRGVLGGETERIPSHRVEHLVPAIRFWRAITSPIE